MIWLTWRQFRTQAAVVFGLLAGRWLECNSDIRQIHGWIDGAAIHAGFRPRTDMAGQRHALAGVDRQGDPVGGAQRMRQAETPEQQITGKQAKKWSGYTSTLDAARDHAT